MGGGVYPVIANNYVLFALLADMRNEESLCPPRGFPCDLCSEIGLAYLGWEYHSASWLNFAELKEVQRRYVEHCSWESVGLAAVIAMLEVFEDRVVFWFDG